MKVSPIAASGLGALPTADIGKSASPDRIARAKAVLSGEPAPIATDPQVERAEKSIRRIKMKTKASPDRYRPEGTPVLEDQGKSIDAIDASTPVADKVDPNAETPAAIEATQPLSPQFAALAKQKRALQLKERELLTREQALATQSTGTKSMEEYRARIKANALSVLQEEGVTYDQLTEQILASGNESNPAVTRLEAKIAALEKGLETQTKSQVDRDTAQEEQVFTIMGKEAQDLLAKPESNPAISIMGYEPEVMKLIRTMWKEKGIALEVSEAIKMVEEEALPDARAKIAKAEMLKQLLTPAEQQQQAAQQGANKTMRTLTNRDGVSAPLTPRERAIAAFHGTKTR